MVIVLSEPNRALGHLNRYLLGNPTKRAEHREFCAIGTTEGALVGAFFEQVKLNHERFGKHRFVEAVTTNELGETVPKLDKIGRQLYQPEYVQAYVITQSFSAAELDPTVPDNWQRAQQLGQALASSPEYAGHMALVVTERGGKSGLLHNHIVIDAVNRHTGASLKSSKVTHHRLAKTNDRVLAANRFRQREDLVQITQEVDARQKAGETGFSFKTVARDVREQPELVAAKQTERHERWVEQAELAEDRGEAIPLEPFSLEELQARAHAALEDDRAVSWEGLNEAARERGVTIQQRGDEVQIGMMREQPDGSLREPTVADRRRGSTLDGLGVKDIEQSMTQTRERVAEERRMAERQRLFDREKTTREQSRDLTRQRDTLER